VTISDNAIADDQPKTSPGADAFGGKERLEYPGLDFKRDPSPVIHDFYD
jgi:hypothetical protein